MAVTLSILAVGAHTDDCELGAGATLAAHVLAGDSVTIAALSVGEMSRGSATNEAARIDASKKAAAIIGANAWQEHLPDQRFDTQPLLDITQEIERLGERLRPDVVYTHSLADLNEDHRIVARAVRTAFRPVRPWPRKILCFEVPSSTEWGQAFVPTVFRSVHGEPLERKMRALECYAAEMRPRPHPRSRSAIRALAEWRGATAGVLAAEAFELVREVVS